MADSFSVLAEEEEKAGAALERFTASCTASWAAQDMG